MKKKLLQSLFGFCGVLGAACAAFYGFQQLLLKLSRRKKEDSYPMQYFQTAEGRVAYRSVGTGRPLLLVHSMMLGASSAEWDAVIGSLAENYHVYAVDLPGFGNSDCPKEPWTAYQYAQLLHRFITSVIKRPACICGANGGADQTLILSLLHPEDVSRMLLISPEGIGKGFATDTETRELSLLLKPLIGTQKFLMATGKSAIRKELEAAFYAKEKVSDELVRQYTHMARFGIHAQTTYAALAVRFYAADTKPAFEKLSVPFLMLWGEENQLNPAEHFETAEKMKDFGSFVLFEQTGALPHLENSKAFLEQAKEFLK